MELIYIISYSTDFNLKTGEFQSSCFYHVIYMITSFYTVAIGRFCTMVYLGLALVVMVLSRPPGLARYLGLDPWEYHDVLGTWEKRYLNDTFDL